jgi:hypothetical protein
MQVLEDEKDAVLALYERIEQNERHHDLRILHTAEIEERSFKNWTMGFKVMVDEEIHPLPDVSEFLRHDADPSHLPEQKRCSLHLIETFKRMYAS